MQVGMADMDRHSLPTIPHRVGHRPRRGRRNDLCSEPLRHFLKGFPSWTSAVRIRSPALTPRGDTRCLLASFSANSTPVKALRDRLVSLAILPIGDGSGVRCQSRNAFLHQDGQHLDMWLQATGIEIDNPTGVKVLRPGAALLGWAQPRAQPPTVAAARA